MIVLDCESTDSIYASLEAIAGAKRDEIESFLKTIDLSSSPRNHLLLDEFKRTFRTRLAYDATYWFHLTRTTESMSFDQGILPLGDCLDSIFAWLHRLLQDVVSAEQWAEFKKQCPQKAHNWSIAAEDYKRKTENRFHWGPYAILVRDHAFKPEEVDNHDYFSGPEIIEDICYCFEEIYHINVLNIFLEKTKPCIVKFIHDSTESKYVRAALWHLYAITRGEKCSSYCHDCFDGGAVPVRRDQILSREFPKYVAGKALSKSEHTGKPLMPVTIIAPDLNAEEPIPEQPKEKAPPK